MIRVEWITAYLDLGFRGPDASGRMNANINGIELTARAQSESLVSVLATWADDNSDLMFCSPSWDAQHVLNTLEQHLGDHDMPAELDELRLRFGITLSDAEQITEQSMTAGNFWQFTLVNVPRVPFATTGIDETLEYRAVRRCARESQDSLLVGWIATDYPWRKLRAYALRNPACPDSAKLDAASGGATSILLEDPELPESIFRRLIAYEARRYLGSERPKVHHDLLLAIALHPTCAERLVPGLIAHVAPGRGKRSLHVAQRAWSASPDRRDLIHALLLTKARPGKKANQLLTAILGPDPSRHPERIAWLEQHQDSRIRRHAALRPALWVSTD